MYSESSKEMIDPEIGSDIHLTAGKPFFYRDNNGSDFHFLFIDIQQKSPVVLLSNSLNLYRFSYSFEINIMFTPSSQLTTGIAMYRNCHFIKRGTTVMSDVMRDDDDFCFSHNKFVLIRCDIVVRAQSYL